MCVYIYIYIYILALEIPYPSLCPKEGFEKGAPTRKSPEGRAQVTQKRGL